MNYQTEIAENEDYLIRLERKTKDGKVRDRVRFMRVLKSGQTATQKEAGALIGLGIRQSQRLWQKYRVGGLAALTASNYAGGAAKLGESGQQQLMERLKNDDIASLEQARNYLAQAFGINYTIGGVSYLFKRLKVKLKTGRPTNINQEAVLMEEFKKKNIRS